MTKFESLLFYLSVYILSAFFLSISKKEKNKKIDFMFIVAIMLPVLLAAFRDNVGTDFENYLRMYKVQSNISFSQWLQNSGRYIDGTPFGIWLVSRIAGMFNSQEVYFGLLAGLVVTPIFLFIKNEVNKECSFLTAFMFLTGTFTTSLNIAKQCVALAFIIYGLRYVFERKFLKFLFCVLVAYSFHISAIVAVFIYFFWKKEDSKFSFKRLCLISLSIVFVLSVSTVLEHVGGRFVAYTETADVEFNNRTFYLDLIWCVLFFVFRKKYVEVDLKNNLLITLFLVGLIMTFTGFVSPFVKRIALYYIFTQSILIAQIPLLFLKNERVIIKLIVFAYAVFIFAYSVYILGHLEVVPYNFITRSVI